MRFAALVALAVVASTVPGLAAPTPHSPRWVVSSADANTAVDTPVFNGTLPFRIGTVILNDPVPSKRDTTSDFVDAIEALFNELPAARKRDITADITAALQTLLDEAGSALSDVKRDSASSDVEERAIKLPEISSSVTSGLRNAANVATIGGGLANIFNAIDGISSTNNTRRQAESLPEERSFKIPTSLKNIGNNASIGFGADAIFNAFNGTKRDSIQTSDGVDGAGAAPQFEDRSFTLPSSILSKIPIAASVGGTTASLFSAFDGSSDSMKRDLVTPELPPSAVDGSLSNDQSPTPSIPTALLEDRSLTSLLKSLGNVASIGFSADSILSAVDGSSNTKRDFVQTPDEVDIVSLGGATPQFEDRSLTIPSSAASILSKLATAASVGGTAASLFSAFDGSSNSMRRDLGMDSGTLPWPEA
ncbi:uncharacterized protein EDB91DRAFT_1083059 [Suillus paluster]|uniref:uncharacterized protein n=1 Tax=Suillus paluster TaxID=48578 RepID=UPI001B8803B1|nr:uncharacterized protein EDB91DRAFT_1083059 [Suillus paluster]KAG1737548.1 hypothetical protein EDB91DRAFT_1083059 [Suillus paluster]